MEDDRAGNNCVSEHIYARVITIYAVVGEWALWPVFKAYIRSRSHEVILSSQCIKALPALAAPATCDQLVMRW